MKFLKSLPAKLVYGVVTGMVIGLLLAGDILPAAFNTGAMQVVVTIKYILNQLINFCVPLIILGFIAPSITKLGSSASRILAVALILAYVSSVCAAFVSAGAGYAIIPHLSITNVVNGLRQAPEAIFQLDIPQIMSVMSALVISVLLGLAVTMTPAKVISQALDEFQRIVLLIVSKLVNSQAAAVATVVPVAIAIGTPPGVIVAMASAAYGYYILPTYPSDLAAITFDRSGTTHIGKFVINHSFIAPGLIGVLTAVAVGWVLGMIYGYI